MVHRRAKIAHFFQAKNTTTPHYGKIAKSVLTKLFDRENFEDLVTKLAESFFKKSFKSIYQNICTSGKTSLVFINFMEHATHKYKMAKSFVKLNHSRKVTFFRENM